MEWDLSQLVKVDDPDFIAERMNGAITAAELFREKHRGRIENYNPQQVFEMLEEMSDLELEFEGSFMYAFLAYSADMNEEVAKRLNDTARRASTVLNQHVAFVDLDLGKLISSKPEIIEANELSEYKHYLEKIKRRIPYMLSEEQEQLAIMKDKNGIIAWSMLQGDWLATRTFDIGSGYRPVAGAARGRAGHRSPGHYPPSVS